MNKQALNKADKIRKTINEYEYHDSILRELNKYEYGKININNRGFNIEHGLEKEIKKIVEKRMERLLKEINKLTELG